MIGDPAENSTLQIPEIAINEQQEQNDIAPTSMGPHVTEIRNAPSSMEYLTIRTEYIEKFCLSNDWRFGHFNAFYNSGRNSMQGTLLEFQINLQQLFFDMVCQSCSKLGNSLWSC